MQFKDIEEALRNLNQRGYVRSLRNGTTGIGYTLEQLLGLRESNISIPDIGGRIEVKAVRKDSDSLITLFTFNKGVWKISQKELISQYGYEDKKGRKALKNTLFYKHSIPQGLTIDVDEKNNVVNLIDVYTGQALATWDMYVIVGKFMTKLGRLLLVLADRDKRKGVEWFHYNEAYLLTDPQARKFIEAFKQGSIGIDLRMHLRENGTVRNRGTAFRIREKDLILLYDKRKKII